VNPIGNKYLQNLRKDESKLFVLILFGQTKYHD